MATSPDPSRLLGAMAFAVLFGIVHAMMPGHGKSVLVTYHLGRPGHVLGGVSSSVLLVLTHVGMAVVLVLAGFIVVQRTFVGAGRTPALETTSSVLVILIGLWLFVRSLKGHHHNMRTHQGRFLSIAAGFVPCPLTTFIMVYALAHGIVIAGLLVTLAMAGGMVVTISAFAVTAVLFHKRFFESAIGEKSCCIAPPACSRPEARSPSWARASGFTSCADAPGAQSPERQAIACGGVSIL